MVFVGSLGLTNRSLQENFFEEVFWRFFFGQTQGEVCRVQDVQCLVPFLQCSFQALTRPGLIRLINDFVAWAKCCASNQNSSCIIKLVRRSVVMLILPRSVGRLPQEHLPQLANTANLSEPQLEPTKATPPKKNMFFC